MAMLAGIALTAVGIALLNKVWKECVWPMRGAHGSRSQIIEIDEYEILNEDQDKASQGYRVEIRDGND